MFFSSFAIKSGCTSKDFKTVVIRGFPPEKGKKKKSGTQSLKLKTKDVQIGGSEGLATMFFNH